MSTTVEWLCFRCGAKTAEVPVPTDAAATALQDPGPLCCKRPKREKLIDEYADWTTNPAAKQRCVDALIRLLTWVPPGQEPLIPPDLPATVSPPPRPSWRTHKATPRELRRIRKLAPPPAAGEGEG